MARHAKRRANPYVPSFPTHVPVHIRRKNWGGLRPMDRVTVQEGKAPPYQAIIDVLTENATVIWVLPAVSGSRRAFHYSDDVDITPIPGQVPKQNR